MMKIEIMDTTLRDGEQTPKVSFTFEEKSNIARKLLQDAMVDRIEVASARVSKGEMSSAKTIAAWASGKEGFLDRIEVLGFVDGKISVDWIVESGLRVINLLCKGSLNHVTNQLRKKPVEHFKDIKETVRYAREKGLLVNIYLEDWSNGMINSPEYVFELIEELKSEDIKRIMLPDTLGVLSPEETYGYCSMVVSRYPDLHFDFHAHNDYDMATANSLEGARAGCRGIHTTVNGLGERTGNAALSSVVSAINDHLPGSQLQVVEAELNNISKIVELFSGIRIPPNKPIIGENVFTQTCGVHADGDNKGNLYFNKLLPERFGRARKYALGKTSGKASILKNLEELGIELDRESVAKVTERIVELGDRKENITTEDLPYIITDVLGSKFIEEKIKVINYSLSKVMDLAPVATLSLEVEGKILNETAVGDGQYDAFMKALGAIYSKMGRTLPQLVDYAVAIPPGGNTNALVETTISWKTEEREFKTRGLDSDQTEAAIKATVRMLNIIANGEA
jgi:(R)-citramalate synthase